MHDMETLESRFAHLLQPIRELTKNWDVDVASELNDYLEELDEMCITFDGGKTTLNFAEAALLIQGSTCIYSKKIELLHKLVFQTMEYINNRDSKKKKDASAEKKGSADDNDGNEDDGDNAEFTAVDTDVTEDSKKMDATSMVKVISLSPECLIILETTEKQKFPLISIKNEVLCSQKDFKINMFLPGEGDFILLTHGANPFVRVQDYELQQQEQPQGTVVGNEAPLQGDCFRGDDAPEDDFLPLEDGGVEMDQQVDEHVERHQAPSEGRGVREKRQIEAEKLRKQEAPPAVNVWQLNDLYADLGADKPLQPGKCYKVPDGLDGGKRKRKSPKPLQDFKGWFKGAYDPPEHKLKNGPKSTDLNYIYLSMIKDKVRSRKRVNRRAGLIVSDEELRRTFLLPESAAPHEELAEGFEHPELQDADDDHQDFAEDPAGGFVGDGPDDELSYEDLVKLRVEQLVVNSGAYTQESALSRRVKDWEEKIKPELAQQEQRTVFDIHEYGDNIVSSLGDVGRRRMFSSIVSGLDNFEACKFLLASLQLANDNTVEIESTPGLEESLDSMSLTLLSAQRATDRFKTMTGSS